MRASLRGPALLAVGAALGLRSLAAAHDDPTGCSSTGVALTLGLFRADGRTGLAGAVSECERMAYRVTLRKVDASMCAFSGGTLTLTTADGVSQPVAATVPCIGGQTKDASATNTGPIDCAPETTSLVSELVPYAVRREDVAVGRVKAVARYEGGVTHDAATNTPGVGAVVDRTVSITSCSDADPCTLDVCDPMKPGVAACANPPLCDDDDPTTSDTCAAGRCTFTPIASSDRTVCGGGRRD